MKIACFAALLFGCMTIPALAQPAVTAVPLIFDTDLGNDCDDVLAMGMIHALQSRGECELLAVTLTKDHELAGPFADAVNTFYGRGEVPIGVCRSGVTPEQGRFNGLAAVKNEQGEFRYPHDLTSGKDASDAVKVLRQVLASAADQSVVVVQVGFSTNLDDLLKSAADADSPLSGEELTRRKVRELVVMAGAFSKIRNGKGEMVDHKEYNVIKDLNAATRLAQHWPTPMLWSGFEIGIALPYPHQSILQDYGYVAHHPLAEAYTLYNPPPHDRPTWDLTAVLQAVRPDRGYFNLSPPGQVTVEADGLTTFHEDSAGRHRYMVLTPAQQPRTLEALVQLSSQPPTR